MHQTSKEYTKFRLVFILNFYKQKEKGISCQALSTTEEKEEGVDGV